MLRELNNQELNCVAGGYTVTDVYAPKDVYPPVIDGYELVGWTTQSIVDTWEVATGLFSTKVYSKETVYVDPIYAPVTMVYYY